MKFQELVLLKHKELPPNVSNKDSTTDKTLTGSSTKNVVSKPHPSFYNCYEAYISQDSV